MIQENDRQPQEPFTFHYYPKNQPPVVTPVTAVKKKSVEQWIDNLKDRYNNVSFAVFQCPKKQAPGSRSQKKKNKKNKREEQEKIKRSPQLWQPCSIAETWDRELNYSLSRPS